MHEFDELFFEDFRVGAYELLEPTGVTGLDLQELLTQQQLAGIIFTLTFGLIGGIGRTRVRWRRLKAHTPIVKLCLTLLEACNISIHSDDVGVESDSLTFPSPLLVRVLN
jgi:hypothetical protein